MLRRTLFREQRTLRRAQISAQDVAATASGGRADNAGVFKMIFHGCIETRIFLPYLPAPAVHNADPAPFAGHRLEILPDQLQRGPVPARGNHLRIIIDYGGFFFADQLQEKKDGVQDIFSGKAGNHTRQRESGKALFPCYGRHMPRQDKAV